MAQFKAKDITGRRYGKLTAIQRTPKRTKSGSYIWLCKCDCGNYVNVCIDNLRENGGTQSCGCINIKDTAELEKAFIARFNEKYGDRFEYIKGYEKARHCMITAKCKICGDIITRDKHSLKHIKCKRCEKEKQFIERFNEYYGAHFEYIGGYKTDPKSTIVIKCKQCGHIRERKRSDIFSDGNIACLLCGNNRKELPYKICECVECGETFKQYSPQQTLCKVCHIKKEKAKRAARKRLREARAASNGKVDYSITLAKLIERDNHICQLCGREVNESDYVYIGDTFIAGNDYPSIDHIKPLSKGGVHQWDNVQLAHRLCNSIKCNKEN